MLGAGTATRIQHLKGPDTSYCTNTRVTVFNSDTIASVKNAGEQVRLLPSIYDLHR